MQGKVVIFALNVEDEFSIDDILTMDGFKKSEEKEYFRKTLVFPTEKKKQVISYLRKHQDEVVAAIISESEKGD